MIPRVILLMFNEFMFNDSFFPVLQYCLRCMLIILVVPCIFEVLDGLVGFGFVYEIVDVFRKIVFLLPFYTYFSISKRLVFAFLPQSFKTSFT